MPKSQFIDPKKALHPGYIHFEDIPVNQYSRTTDEEKTLYSRDDMLRIYRDMRVIREFELMLGEIKSNSVYNGIYYKNPGPTHLAIGEEAVAVGSAYCLGCEDIIFGTHRNHGDVIAKGLSAIRKLSEDELYEIMSGYLDGDILRIVEAEDVTGDIRSISEDFLLYGALAEIFAKNTGFNRGLGGSMHLFFLPFGIYPNNAIVGGAAPLALGAALYKRINKKPGIVVANIGDGALGRGSVLESINMSAMDQIKRLWRDNDSAGSGLPILFNISDNFYAMGGQTMGETMAFGMAARLGAGISPDQLHSERINGCDPFAVIDASRRKRELLLRGEGPAMLDIVTYRTVGHSASDPFSYRTEEELEAWKAVDPIKTFHDRLIIGGIASGDELEAIDSEVLERITKICRLSADNELSPRMDMSSDPVGELMFSNGHVEAMDTSREPELLLPLDQNPRVCEIARKSRSAIDESGEQLAAGEYVEYRDAIFEAVLDKFSKDPTLIAYGEEHRDWGGAHGAYVGLSESLPYHRFFNAPISEAAIVGSAVGYAMCGGRAIVELMYADFLGCAADELFNQAAKWQAMSAGTLKLPMVVRVAVGSEYGAQHSQDWTALPVHIPGLKVVFPATPYDAKGLLNSALSGTDPVIFFESKRIYDVGESLHEGGVPKEYYELPIGEPDIKRAGSDVTILSIGAALYRALEAADRLEHEYKISAEVIDARSIVPFDYEPVLSSLKKTGRMIIVGDGCERGSVMKNMAADISELAFDYLDAPIAVLGAKNQITPCCELEDTFFPQADGIIAAINMRLIPIEGREAEPSLGDKAKLERAKRGI